MHNEIKVYGTDDCSDTRTALAYLKSLGLNYNYVNLDTDARAEERVKEYNNGRRVMPTIELISGGETRVLSNPPLEELADAIEKAGLGKQQVLDEDPPIDAPERWRKAS
jgi:glutaredoxin